MYITWINDSKYIYVYMPEGGGGGSTTTQKVRPICVYVSQNVVSNEKAHACVYIELSNFVPGCVTGP